MLRIEDIIPNNSAEVGSLAHRVIGRLAAATRHPSPQQILLAVDEELPGLRPDQGRYQRQLAASAASAYFGRLLPPPRFAFHGHELHLGSGRVDLVWTDLFEGALVIDEIKTGRMGLAQRDIAQAQRYLDDGLELVGPRLVAVRLLSTSRPDHSLLLRPNQTPSPLAGSEYTTR